MPRREAVETHTKGSEASTWKRTDSLFGWPSLGTRDNVNFFRLTALRMVVVCLTSCTPGCCGVKAGLFCCGAGRGRGGLPGPPGAPKCWGCTRITWCHPAQAMLQGNRGAAWCMVVCLVL